MKDNLVHQGLENEGIRNGISQMIYDYNFTNNEDNEYFPYPRKGTPIECSLHRIESAKRLVDYQNRLLVKEVGLLGQLSIMEQFKWQEYDISEFTYNTKEFSLSFIGTEDEYKNLCETMNINAEDYL